MKPKFVPLLFAALLPLFIAAACAPNGEEKAELSPTGAYGGDGLLYAFDGLIEQVTATFDDVTALAERNPVAVQQNPQLAEAVEKIRRETDGVPNDSETLTRLFKARDAYVAARTLTNREDLEQNMKNARTALETARALLPLFVSSSPPDSVDTMRAVKEAETANP